MTIIDLEKWKAAAAPIENMDMDDVAKGHKLLMEMPEEDSGNLLMFIRFIYLADVAAGLKGGKGFELFEEIDSLYKAAVCKHENVALFICQDCGHYVNFKKGGGL